MDIDLPRVIYEKPTLDYVMSRGHQPGKHSRIALEVATRVWLRTVTGEAQNWHCCFCGCETTLEPNRKHSVTLEHVTPKAEGGQDVWENSAMSCDNCNNKRGTQDAAEFIASGYKRTPKPCVEGFQSARDRQAYKRAEKLAARGWKFWHESTQVWVDIDISSWLYLRTVGDETRNEILELYGETHE